MSHRSGVTPNMATAALIRSYAALVLEEYGSDEDGPAIFHAVMETRNAEEVCHLGRAILSRHEALADTWCRFGRPSYPEQLAVLAERLGWSA